MPSPFPLNGLKYDGPAYNALADFGWRSTSGARSAAASSRTRPVRSPRPTPFTNVLLGIHAELASTYFQIRALDAEIAIVREAVGWRGEALKIAGPGPRRSGQRSRTGPIRNRRWPRPRRKSPSCRPSATASKTPLPFSSGRMPPPSPSMRTPADCRARRRSPRVSRVIFSSGVPTSPRPSNSSPRRRRGSAWPKRSFSRASRSSETVDSTSGDLDILFDPASIMWTYGPRVRVPVFSGGKDRFNLSRAPRHARRGARHLPGIVSHRRRRRREQPLGTPAPRQGSDALGRARASATRAAQLARTQYEAVPPRISTSSPRTAPP